jgi:hypothetical protein
VNEDYLEYLLELDKKLKFVHEDEVARMSQATRDLEPALEKLRLKALSKVREAAREGAGWGKAEYGWLAGRGFVLHCGGVKAIIDVH